MRIAVDVVSIFVDIHYLALHSAGGSPHYISSVISLADKFGFLSIWEYDA